MTKRSGERSYRRKQPGERSQEREARNVARRKKPCECSLGKAVRIEQPGESSRKEKPGKSSWEKSQDKEAKRRKKRSLPCEHIGTRQAN